MVRELRSPLGPGLYVPRGFKPVQLAAVKGKSPEEWDIDTWWEWKPPFPLDPPNLVYLLKTREGITLDILTDHLAAVTLADDLGGYVQPWAA